MVAEQLPVVIEMFARMKENQQGNLRSYCAERVLFWLRHYAIPGKPSESYPNGDQLSRPDAEIAKKIRVTFGNFVFLNSGSTEGEIKKMIEVLEQASNLYDNRTSENHNICTAMVVRSPRVYKPLHRYLLMALGSSSFYEWQEIDRKKLAQCFAAFCHDDLEILEELAVKYSQTRQENAGLINTLSQYSSLDD